MGFKTSKERDKASFIMKYPSLMARAHEWSRLDYIVFSQE
jgi:hypothetical protein